jgi:hypothetical protein
MAITSQHLQWISITLAVLAAGLGWWSARVPLQYVKSYEEAFVEELKNLHARAEQHANFAAVQNAFARQSHLNALAAISALASAAIQVALIFS